MWTDDAIAVDPARLDRAIDAARQYIPRTIRYVRQNLTKYERFARLRELLAPHVSELR